MAENQIMHRQLYNATDIFPRKKTWTVLVQVIERRKKNISTSTSSPVEYRSYLLTDMQGMLISAVAYADDIAYFERSLLPYKRYYVSNAYVKFAKPIYRVSEYTYSWVFYNTTLVEPYEEPIPPQLPYDFQLKNFAELHRFSGLDTPINIKCMVVHAYPEIIVREELPARDFVVIDQEKKPLILRMWREVVKNYAAVLASRLPDAIMIVAMNMKVTTFNGISLSSRSSSVFLIEPPIKETAEMKEWYAANENDVQTLVKANAYKDKNRSLVKPKRNEIVSISSAIANIKDTKTAWIGGKLRLLPAQETFWYNACKNCNKTIIADPKWRVKCPSCNEYSEIHTRTHVSVFITDDSATTTVDLYSPEAEYLIPYSPLELKTMAEQGKSAENELGAVLDGKQVICYVKYFDKTIRGNTITKYPVLKVYLESDLFGDEMVMHQATGSSYSDLEQVVGEGKKSENKIPSLPTVTHAKEKQLFSPTTKEVIEEISTDSGFGSSDYASGMVTKRSLNFDSNEFPPAPTQTKVEIKDAVKSAMSESPNKKNKNKYKQN